MFKNVASQVAFFYSYDSTTGLPKTGDAANMVCYVSKDAGSVTAIASNSGVPTEVDSTNAKGYYKISLSQAETNADTLLFSAKSSTANIVVLGAPATVFTVQQDPTAVAMTESYSALNGTKTSAQAFYEILALLNNFAISGTTLTTKKVDGTTTAATYTLNDGTSPTSITRAS